MNNRKLKDVLLEVLKYNAELRKNLNSRENLCNEYSDYSDIRTFKDLYRITKNKDKSRTMIRVINNYNDFTSRKYDLIQINKEYHFPIIVNDRAFPDPINVSESKYIKDNLDKDFKIVSITRTDINDQLIKMDIDDYDEVLVIVE